MSALEHFEAYEAAVAEMKDAESDPLRLSARMIAYIGAENAKEFTDIAGEIGRRFDLLTPGQDRERTALRRARRKALQIARAAASLHDDMARLLELTEPTSAESESRDGR